MSSSAPQTPRTVRIVRRHHLLVRLAHLANVPLLLGLIASGLSIHWAAPVFTHAVDPVTGSRDLVGDLSVAIARLTGDTHVAPRDWIVMHLGLGTFSLASALRLHWLLVYLFMLNGALYLIEYGDKWGDNHDAQIVRVVYRRGNREPHPVLKADVSAGRQPLTVHFDGGSSSDLDKDKLTWEWSIQGKASDADTSTLTHTFDQPGRYIVTMNVTDAAGASRSTSTEIRVGNAAPKVELLSPVHGSFVDWGQTVRYRIAASDLEDGSTDDGKIASGRVLLNRQFEARRASTNADAGDDAGIHPGLALMRKTTCFSCHTTKSQSAGPAYREVGRKYAADASARERIANKVITGGTGVWGPKPMPPHPQHTIEQTRLMVDWILSLASDGTAEPVPGVHGFFRADAPGPLTGK